MKKIVKVILFFLLLVGIVLFVMQNLNEPVDITLFSGQNVVTTEMIVVVMIAFITGMLVGMLFTGIQWYKTKKKLRMLADEYEKMQQEVDLLRNQEIMDFEEE